MDFFISKTQKNRAKTFFHEKVCHNSEIINSLIQKNRAKKFHEKLSCNSEIINSLIQKNRANQSMKNYLVILR